VKANAVNEVSSHILERPEVADDQMVTIVLTIDAVADILRIDVIHGDRVGPWRYRAAIPLHNKGMDQLLALEIAQRNVLSLEGDICV
jgi:hypothetical protein